MGREGGMRVGQGKGQGGLVKGGDFVLGSSAYHILVAKAIPYKTRLQGIIPLPCPALHSSSHAQVRPHVRAACVTLHAFMLTRCRQDGVSTAACNGWAAGRAWRGARRVCRGWRGAGGAWRGGWCGDSRGWRRLMDLGWRFVTVVLGRGAAWQG